MAEEDNVSYTHAPGDLGPESVVFDDWLRVEKVTVVPNTGADAKVEVRAETLDPTVVHPWKSLRWHHDPDSAPRAHDVVRVTVTKVRPPATPEDMEPTVGPESDHLDMDGPRD